MLVTANHAPPGEVTNTIGAKQGDGSSTDASIFASPVADAGARSVESFTVAEAPSLELRQLTIALKDAIGFVP